MSHIIPKPGLNIKLEAEFLLKGMEKSGIQTDEGIKIAGNNYIKMFRMNNEKLEIHGKITLSL